MKKYLLGLLFLVSLDTMAQNNVKGHIVSSTSNKADSEIDKGIDKGFDKGIEKIGNVFTKKKKDKKGENIASASAKKSNHTTVSDKTETAPALPSDLQPQELKAYNNFDFIAGENILFEDNFEGDMDGEFAAHWNLIGGQGVVNTYEGTKFLILTEGNFAKVSPRMKHPSYLTDPFTVELDFLYSPAKDDYGINLFFVDASGDDSRSISVLMSGEVNTNYFPNDLKGNCPSELSVGWHHFSFAYKNGQMKVYVDQNRVLVIPSCGFVPVSLQIGGIAPTRFDNVKIAAGGGMNMLNKLLTDGKFITHGITFDVNKSSIKPESMGVLNELAKFLKSNSSLKIEIGGHTDSDGSDALNNKLSQERAEAVKKQLITMGIEGNRLTAKGYGAAKPISKNDTPEGKANNRRVEFTKQ